MKDENESIKTPSPSENNSELGRGGASMEPEIRISHGGEGWTLHYGTRVAGPYEYLDATACRRAWIKLSGLNQEEIEAWEKNPEKAERKPDLLPAKVLGAILQARTALIEPELRAAPAGEEGIATRVSGLRAGLVDERVNLNAQIVSEQGQKALPRSLAIRCTRCMKEVEVDLSDPDHSDLLEAVIFKDRAALHRRAEALLVKRIGSQCEKKKDHRVAVDEEENMDYAVLGARELLEEMERFDQQAYTSRRVHLVEVRPPPSKKVRLLGRVAVDPSTRDICILADSAEPLESQVAGFEVTNEDRAEWPRWFNGELDISAQVAPDMVGRENVQQSYLLLLHSAAEIPDVNGRPIRGCIRCLCVGDTKTYKSEGAKDLTRGHYNLGGYIVAESASRTGITYTIDSEERAIVWGELPNNDLGLVVIDGLHTIFAEEMKELREALENQMIIVRRMVSGEALARTRVIGILNPDKPMNQYPYPCMAVKDTAAFYDPPDVTRWDLFLVFGEGDVPAEDIARRRPASRPIPEETFKRHVYWAWSRRPEQIRYTEKATGLIMKVSVELVEKYSLSSLPIVHLGVRDILCRLSVAQAALSHSTDEAHILVVVDQIHVEKAVEFYMDMMDRLKLGEYKLEEEGRLEITPSELVEMVGVLTERHLAILNSIKIHSKSSTALAGELDVSVDTIQRDYGLLRRYGLITTRPRVGVCLTARGVIFLGALSQGNVLIPARNEDIKPIQQELPAENAGIRIIPDVGDEKKSPSEARPSREEAIHGFLDAEGDSTTILRLQAHLEGQGYGLDGLPDELARLQYEEKVIVTPNTINLGPKWRKTPEEAEPSPADGTRGTPGKVEPFEAVMGIWAGLEKDGEGTAILEAVAELLRQDGFEDPYGLVTEAVSQGHLEREGWGLELVGAELRPLGEEGKCEICDRQAQLYADVEGKWPVCLRCRLGQPAAWPDRLWRFRVVTR